MSSVQRRPFLASAFARLSISTRIRLDCGLLNVHRQFSRSHMANVFEQRECGFFIACQTLGRR
ncbi:hypothetical protein B4U79_01245 [Dinothrombium tinctorium]|uniref:Uncharacterized protein n=1 Tax=Dinothrombium tinctorium TaxID=1965070 RepID=A0A443QT02_9ACAR|nr:hypothetical protein B4U79_10150 [Dinothrombium tinctorium]RWS14874.1 hypothetical protein B4U79_01245 [Dinothrombium tinctorium]